MPLCGMPLLLSSGVEGLEKKVDVISQIGYNGTE